LTERVVLCCVVLCCRRLTTLYVVNRVSITSSWSHYHMNIIPSP